MNLLIMKDHPPCPEESLLSTPGSGGEGIGIRAKLFNHHQMHSPRELQTSTLEKSLKKSVHMVLVPSTAPTISAGSSLSSPQGCVIPSYSPRTREEIPLFEHTSARDPQPWSFPTEACPHFAPDHKAFALHLAGTTSLVFE